MAAITRVAFSWLDAAWAQSWPWFLFVALLAVTATSQLAVLFVNWLVTLAVPPAFLPRLHYAEGIPPDARSVVVIPALVSKLDDVDELLENLEVHYLANRDPYIQFGLLTDFADACLQNLDTDAAVLKALADGIAALNRKYGDGANSSGESGPDTGNTVTSVPRHPAPMGDPFFVCHRPRLWNEHEGVWMGFERKRGKLCAFNSLMRGRGGDAFLLLAGDAVNEPKFVASVQNFPRILQIPPVRYVITLDADTLLPRGTARQLIGAMAHPLNRPLLDPTERTVVSGYGIMQPLVGVTLPSAERSPYARTFCCDAGVDPYTRMVSDVYQDLFQQGSFIGKGIYDLTAVDLTTSDSLPDNRILSHDLIEGCYARSGLLSDVQLYEEYPSRYSADANRRQRWIRGDWQLLPWLLPRAPASARGTLGNKHKRNPLSALSLWKLADNLRRSLYAPALLGLFLAGWFGLPRPALWTLGLLVLTFTLPLISSLYAATRQPGDVSLKLHIGAIIRSLGRQVLREFLTLIWLPYEAYYSLDAVFRALWRMGFSHRHLLLWNPSHMAETMVPRTLGGIFRQMWICPLLAASIAVLVAPRLSALASAAPFVLMWLSAPALAWAMSRPTERKAYAAEQDQRRFLRILARQTWAFFERYVDQEHHWLPPDNMQEAPVAVVAHRTSPTNMGLNLLSHLAAHDFGYLGAGRMLERLEKCLSAMSALPRHRGHFYNWYDTRTLKPLFPEYISTVDSGNLAGHLLTLRAGLLTIPDEPVYDVRLLDGLADTVAALTFALTNALSNPPGIAPNSPAWQGFMTKLEDARATPDLNLHDVSDHARQILAEAENLRDILHPAPETDAAFWLDALISQCRDLNADLRAFLPPIGAILTNKALNLPTWRQLARLDTRLLQESDRDAGRDLRRRAGERVALAEKLARKAADMADMDFSFLYDARRDLLTIGYNIPDQQADPGFYDLLASEARLTYFVTIAQGQIPQDSWFRLGRLLTNVKGAPVLLSWSGSMFEYLMPMLVMPSYEGTLLDETCRGAVARQIEYGRQLGLPWGISESCYNMLDPSYNYQYRAFGVPGLGFKRGLGDDVVFAPYAAVMALMVNPEAAIRNLQELTTQGMRGRFGLYEAVDRTPIRLQRDQDKAIIRSFMAHHQGMSLLSLAHVLLNRPMQRRFLSDPLFKAADLLLQERVPKIAPEYLPDVGGASLASAAARGAENRLRVFHDPSTPTPVVQLLSNGQYHVMVSSSGGGYSRYRDLAVTRWREDATRDDHGSFLYLRDVTSGDFWSAAYQPTCGHPDHFEVIFSDSRAEFRVRKRDFDSHLEIAVSPEDDMELRRLHLTNRAKVRRVVELTSYAEIVLAPVGADAQHPAFSNLFVQTEIVPSLQAILATRRPREASEPRWWACHMLAAHGADIIAISYETDRNRFMGRDRDLSCPAAMDGPELSDTKGAVLDPMASIRCRVALEAGQTAVFDFVTGISDQREGSLAQIEKFRDRRLADRVFDLAWTHSQVLLHQFNASLREARLYQQMAASILYANAPMRAKANVLSANMRNQSGLWGQSISGDLPIVLLKISNTSQIDLVAQLVKAHAYWRVKGLLVDLVIWNEERAGYRQQLQDLILGLIPTGAETHLIDRPGGIFVRPEQQLSREDRILIQAAARVILSDTHGSLAEQLSRRLSASPPLLASPTFGDKGREDAPSVGPSRIPSQKMARSHAEPKIWPDISETLLTPERLDSLVLRTPFGGFSADEKEYVIALPEGVCLPAPWVNVLSNPQFGTIVSESGTAYTWRENAHEFRLTPWENDPIRDAGGEVMYLRDEETGHFWSPTLLPCRGKGSYLIRHGFGYSIFEHEEEGIHTELTIFVAAEEPVKLSVLRVTNRSGRKRRLSITGYVEWVLGDTRSRTAMHVITEPDEGRGALYAHNAYSIDFPGRVAFFDLIAPEVSSNQNLARSMTCDRREFIGRNGNLREPVGMDLVRLSGRCGPALDPCSAIRATLNLEPGEEREITLLLGAANDALTAAALVQQFRVSGAPAIALDTVRAHWCHLLTQVQVETPDLALDVLANGWLQYQIIACRFQARSGYYQSGGAFGFRDQLQDSMAMVYAAPASSREQLVRCAGHQFPQGDVQHWWHPPLDRGVRTHCSDDYLWLPLATARYVQITGDLAVLSEQIDYIEGRTVGPDEESLYDLPIRSSVRESLYDHCLRALELGFTKGRHGLPLMGSGDWNDGMNRVGWQGSGESVWLGFFLHTVLTEFTKTARVYGDPVFAERCDDEAAALRQNLEAHAWDGAWYRRAWFDDGTPLGSAQNEECRIDSLSQSWAVLSDAAPDERRRQAMAAVDKLLVRRDRGIIQLLDPPFDASALEPGYIKGYVPGVRENGGQYTHAALWVVMAFAKLGEADRAWELLAMLSPVNHSLRNAQVYKVEPYVVAADVYAVPPHAGRGGWSWYTGAAGWMYRLILESLLGFTQENGHLTLRPLLPAAWPGFTLSCRHGSALYRVHVRQTDDEPETVTPLPLVDDSQIHDVDWICHNKHGEGA